ncbi:MAG: hypothetical protein MJ002_00110 [Paludibacteraceae bacterium]|nr:hypothetical protein [Paludibacteraceae bacterium]
MKAYQKAEMIAKNLPTGSYAAGCPAQQKAGSSVLVPGGSTMSAPQYCYMCEIAG